MKHTIHCYDYSDKFHSNSYSSRLVLIPRHLPNRLWALYSSTPPWWTESMSSVFVLRAWLEPWLWIGYGGLFGSNPTEVVLLEDLFIVVLLVDCVHSPVQKLLISFMSIHNPSTGRRLRKLEICHNERKQDVMTCLTWLSSSHYLFLPVCISIRMEEIWESSDPWPYLTSEDISIFVLH